MKWFFKILGVLALFFIGLQLRAQPTALNDSNHDYQELAKQFFNSNYIDLDEGMKMVLKSQHKDEFGKMHMRFIQTYNNIKVELGYYNLHFNGKTLYAHNGEIVSNVSFIEEIILSEAEAIDIAKQELKLENTDESITVRQPLGFLALDGITNMRGTFSHIKNKETGTYELCYNFTLVNDNALKVYDCWINATTGQAKLLRDAAQYCSIGTGSGNTGYYGNQTLTTQWTGSITKHRLIDYCRNIITKKCNSTNGSGQCTGGHYSDDDNNWTDGDDLQGVSVHWATQRSYDYFDFAFNFQGVDGDAVVTVDARAGWTGGNSAAWQSTNQLVIAGPSNGIGGFTALDVIAHEWTHGIIQHSSGLYGNLESDALNESFADIFGVMTEYFVEGITPGIYQIGERITNIELIPELGTTAISNLQDPSLTNQASIYEGVDWYSGPSDNTFEYVNRGVQNHWFYLLAEGGSQTIDGVTYNVTGIGKESAAQVAFKNLRDYLSEYSEYNDSKNGSILAAIDLWGECDWRVEQVINAWNAVGVSSVGGKYYETYMDCFRSNVFTALGWSYNENALHTLHAECDFIGGGPVELSAGTKIRFAAGAVLRDGIHARINPCLTSNMRYSFPSNYAGIGNTSIETNEFPGEKEFQELNIFPNPTNGKFTISIKDYNGIGTIEVHNVMGQQVYYFKGNFSQHEIDLSHEKNGLYIVKYTNEQEQLTQRIIKQ